MAAEWNRLLPSPSVGTSLKPRLCTIACTTCGHSGGGRNPPGPSGKAACACGMASSSIYFLFMLKIFFIYVNYTGNINIKYTPSFTVAQRATAYSCRELHSFCP